MSTFKRLTPDYAQQISDALKAADFIANISNELSHSVTIIEDNLIKLLQAGQKADQLSRCVRRIQELHTQLNEMELGSFCGITVKNTCQELWEKLP